MFHVKQRQFAIVSDLRAVGEQFRKANKLSAEAVPVVTFHLHMRKMRGPKRAFVVGLVNRDVKSMLNHWKIFDKTEIQYVSASEIVIFDQKHADLVEIQPKVVI